MECLEISRPYRYHQHAWAARLRADLLIVAPDVARGPSAEGGVADHAGDHARHPRETFVELLVEARAIRRRWIFRVRKIQACPHDAPRIHARVYLVLRDDAPHHQTAAHEQ